MALTILSLTVGTLLGICSGLSLALNLAILIVLMRSKLPRSNPIYLLSALNLFSDCLQTGGILFFLTPTSIAQDYLLAWAQPNQPIWFLFMFVFQVQWYSAIFTLVAISINRLIAVVFPTKAWLINRDAMLWTCGAIFPLSLLLTIIGDFLLPCCRTNFSYEFYSYKFFNWRPANESAINYKNIFLDLPLNIVTTLIILLCYGIIFLKVHQSNKKDVVRQSVALNQQHRRMSEIRYAIQFALISAFFIAAWVSFRVFPLIVSSTESPEWFSLTTFFEIGNCSANALIYVTMNQEVRQQFVASVRTMLGLPTISIPTSINGQNQQASKLQQQQSHHHQSMVVAVIPMKKHSLPLANNKPVQVEKWAKHVNGGIGCVRQQPHQ